MQGRIGAVKTPYSHIFYAVTMLQAESTFFSYQTQYKDLSSFINKLKHDSLLAIEWFENNYMKLNQEKCHLLVSGYKNENIWARIGQTKIWESRKQNC